MPDQPIRPDPGDFCGHPTPAFDGQAMKCAHSLPCPRHPPTAKDQPPPPQPEPIRPEDIKPGDWIRFGKNGLARVTGKPAEGLHIDRPPHWIELSDVLEVRRG